MLRLADSWLRKSEKEKDPFDKYISGFVSFNVLYNMIALERDSRADLTTGDGRRVLESSNVISDKCGLVRRIAPLLAIYLRLIPAFREEYWGRTRIPISQELKNAVANDKPDLVVWYLLMWLYKVRCNLFHGEKDYDDEKQKVIVTHSYELLNEVLSDIILGYRAQYKL